MRHVFALVLLALLAAVCTVPVEAQPMLKRQAQFGVWPAPVTQDMADELGLDAPTGVLIQQVMDGLTGAALGLEAGADRARVHAGLDDLHGDHAPHGLGLLGLVDHAEAALAEQTADPWLLPDLAKFSDIRSLLSQVAIMPA